MICFINICKIINKLSVVLIEILIIVNDIIFKKDSMLNIC